MTEDRSAETIRPSRMEMGSQDPGTTVHHRHAGDGNGLGSRLKSHANDVVESGKSRVAGRIENLGDELERRATRMESQGNFVGRAAANVVRGGSDVLESGAGYLRSHDVSAMRNGLQGTIRQHPFLSLGVAMWAAYRLGKMIG